MTKQQRRERFPEVAAWVDDMLACFDGARVSYTKLPGYEFGIEGSAGVLPNVTEKDKRK